MTATSDPGRLLDRPGEQADEHAERAGCGQGSGQNAEQEITDIGIMPGRERIKRIRHVDREKTKRADRHNHQHQRDGGIEPGMFEKPTPVERAKPDHQHSQHTEAGDQTDAENGAEQHAFFAIVLGDFIESHDLQRKHRQHAGHGVEDDPDKKCRDKSDRSAEMLEIQPEKRLTVPTRPVIGNPGRLCGGLLRRRRGDVLRMARCGNVSVPPHRLVGGTTLIVTVNFCFSGRKQTVSLHA